MRKYIYTNQAGEETVITDYDFDGYITLVKTGQPTLTIKKHKILVGDMIMSKSKSQNYIKEVREKIIKEGLKNGTCKAV